MRVVYNAFIRLLFTRLERLRRQNDYRKQVVIDEDELMLELGFACAWLDGYNTDEGRETASPHR